MGYDKAKQAAYGRKWYQANKERLRLKAKQRRKDNPGRQRDYGRKARGLPAPTRQAPEFCEICCRFSEQALALDHDHTTGKFRGWLCRQCNQALGSLGDSIDALERALAYLRRAIP